MDPHVRRADAHGARVHAVPVPGRGRPVPGGVPFVPGPECADDDRVPREPLEAEEEGVEEPVLEGELEEELGDDLRDAAPVAPGSRSRRR